MKGFPLQPIGKGLGVCSKGVLKQPSILSLQTVLHSCEFPRQHCLDGAPRGKIHQQNPCETWNM